VTHPLVHVGAGTHPFAKGINYDELFKVVEREKKKRRRRRWHVQ